MSSPGSYKGSAGRVKTLDLLASCRDILTLDPKELKDYCLLVKQECGCLDASEAAESLESRYGWDCSSRMADISRAWLELDDDETSSPKASPPVSTKKASASSSAKKQPVVAAPEARPKKRVISLDDDDEEEDEHPSTHEQQGSSQSLAADEAPASSQAATSRRESLLPGGNRVPVMVKASATSGAGRNLLLCQLDDPELSFQGDSGAVGRLSVTSSSLEIDLKGRQYQGTLLPGPTVLLLNLTKPVGAQANYKPVARVEAITNEFCHLEFSRDLLGGLMGEYSGEEGFQIESDGEAEAAGSGKKRGGGAPTGGGRKKKAKLAASDNESNDGSDGGSDDSDDDKPKAKKAKAIKISTVTSRKRSSSGKGGKGKGKAKGAKKSAPKQKKGK